MSDNRTTELLPCPFCSGKAYTVNNDHRYWTVECHDCAAHTGLYATKEYAITAWNERAELGNGTLTAELVEKIVDRNCEWYEGGEIDAQAIADELNAMLGSDDEYEAKVDALLCRLTNGKWSKSRSYDLDFMVSCIEEEFETLYAKELAELGSGTCKITATATSNLMYPDYMTKWYELSCGHSLTLKGDEAPKWCAVCGKAVER